LLQKKAGECNKLSPAFGRSNVLAPINGTAEIYDAVFLYQMAGLVDCSLLRRWRGKSAETAWRHAQIGLKDCFLLLTLSLLSLSMRVLWCSLKMQRIFVILMAGIVWKLLFMTVASDILPWKWLEGAVQNGRV
jgi:hypothetical protein